MARKYGASDLGSDWVTVPRNFRGRKPTSSPTTLAYITAPERGLLKQYALMKTGKDQVGPEGIPSYDDSGFGDSSPQSRWRDPTLAKSNLDSLNRYNKRKKEGWTPTQKLGTPGGGASVYTIPGVKDTPVIKPTPKKYPKYPTDIHPPISKPKDKDRGGRDCPHGWTGTWPKCKPPQTPSTTTTQPEQEPETEEGTSCFVDGVQVELANGSKKNVSKISIGDIVKTQEGSGSVVKVFPAKAGNQLLYGFNGKDPFVTEAHPFMTQDGWKKKSDVKEGDILYRNGLGNQVVESIESKEIPEDTPVYNFHVDNHENYYADG